MFVIFMNVISVVSRPRDSRIISEDRTFLWSKLVPGRAILAQDDFPKVCPNIGFVKQPEAFFVNSSY